MFVANCLLFQYSVRPMLVLQGILTHVGTLLKQKAICNKHKLKPEMHINATYAC